jgi:hypothetical protein
MSTARQATERARAGPVGWTVRRPATGSGRSPERSVPRVRGPGPGVPRRAAPHTVPGPRPAGVAAAGRAVSGPVAGLRRRAALRHCGSLDGRRVAPIPVGISDVWVDPGARNAISERISGPRPVGAPTAPGDRSRGRGGGRVGTGDGDPCVDPARAEGLGGRPARIRAGAGARTDDTSATGRTVRAGERIDRA